MSKLIYDGWYPGMEGYDNRYALMIDEDTLEGYIKPTTKDELETNEMFNYVEIESQPVMTVEQAFKHLKTGFYIGLIGSALIVIHKEMSDKDGYSRLSKWTKDKFKKG